MTLPKDFTKCTQALFGEPLWSDFCRGMAEDPPTSIRLNPEKCRCGDWDVAEAEANVPWCSQGRYLKARPSFTFDPLLHAGMYYVQEAASMFIDFVLRRFAGNKPVTMIDLCAAPGGKSTAARAALPKGSLLISNEPLRARAQILAENLLKWGDEDVIVTNSYPKDFANIGIMADVILADVPCSGEGMFRKDDTAIQEWSLKNVEKCARLQREIVTEAWKCLKPGGLLIYSTCTFNTAEDEENVRFIAEKLGGDVLDLGVEDDWDITGSLLNGFGKPVYRFIPGTTKGEGLFMAALRKNNDEPQPKAVKKKNKTRAKGNDKARGNADEDVKQWLKSPDEYDIIRNNDSLTAIPKAWRATYDLADKNLRVMHAGIPLCEMKGTTAIPAHAHR